MAEKLILLRHGETGPEHQDRYIGHKDIPMADSGYRRIEALADLIRMAGPLRCFSSPLQRCRASAEIVSNRLDIPVQFENDLREVDFGDWEGLSFMEIAAIWPDQVSQWARLDAEFSFPGGESFVDFLRRVKRVADMLASVPEKAVLVCTHGGIIRSLICHFLRLRPEHYILFNVKPATLATLELDGGNAILSGLNETVYPK